VFVFKLLSFIDRLVSYSALYALVVLIFAILTLTLMNILLRPFEITFLWIDPMVRHLVFLSAFLGGVLAIGKRQLIAIDIVARSLEKANFHRTQKYLERVILVVCIGSLIWLNCGSIEFINYAFEFEGVDFLGIQRGCLVAIIPIGFSLMIYRFFYRLILSICPNHPDLKLHLTTDEIQ
jgi:TRAP-type C4-dicarboxylate transport system permease small subunit